MTSIIIPYRNRKKHLDFFLRYTAPLLQKHIDNCEIIIVEQTGGKLFNRGKLLNIGFMETEYCNYFVTHDVDLNPFEKTIKKFYLNEFEDDVQGIYTPATDTLGGIVKFSKETYYKVNGFPNDIWGWGMEDLVFQNRVKFRNIIIKKNILDNSLSKDLWFKIFNDVDDRLLGKDWSTAQFWEVQHLHRTPKIVREMRIVSNGLSNLEYTINGTEHISDNIKKIIVDIGGSREKNISNSFNDVYKKVFSINI
tara:strand:- start:980 stop:1732 length:753 start_codon:yes stop_codon:yes gene_type:complete